MTYETSSPLPNGRRRSRRTSVGRQQEPPNTLNFVPDGARCRFESQGHPSHISTNRIAVSTQGGPDFRSPTISHPLHSPAGPHWIDPTIPRYVPQETRGRANHTAGEIPTSANSHSYEIVSRHRRVHTTHELDCGHDRSSHKDGDEDEDPQNQGRPPLSLWSKAGKTYPVWNGLMSAETQESDEPTKAYLRSFDVQFAGFCFEESLSSWPSFIVKSTTRFRQLPSTAHDQASSPGRPLSNTGHGVLPGVIVQGICTILIDSTFSRLKSEAAAVRSLASNGPWSRPTWMPTAFWQELTSIIQVQDVDQALVSAVHTVWRSTINIARPGLQAVCQSIQLHGFPVTPTIVTGLLLTCCFYQHTGAESASRLQRTGLRKPKVHGSRSSLPKQGPSTHGIEVSPPPRPYVLVTSVFKSQPGMLWACHVHKFDPEHYLDCAHVHTGTEISLRRLNGHLDKKHSHEEHVSNRIKTLTPNTNDKTRWRETFVGIYPLYKPVIDTLNPESNYPLLEDTILETQLREDQKRYLGLSIGEQQDFLTEYRSRMSDLTSFDGVSEFNPRSSAIGLARFASVRLAQNVPSRPPFDSSPNSRDDPVAITSTFEEVERVYTEILNGGIGSHSASCVSSLREKLNILHCLRKAVTNVEGIGLVLDHIDQAKIQIPPSELGHHGSPLIQQAFDDTHTNITQLIAKANGFHVEMVPLLERRLGYLESLNACCSNVEALSSFIEDLLRTQPNLLTALSEPYRSVSFLTPPASVEYTSSDDFSTDLSNHLSIDNVVSTSTLSQPSHFLDWLAQDHSHTTFNVHHTIENECIDPNLLASESPTQDRYRTRNPTFDAATRLE